MRVKVCVLLAMVVAAALAGCAQQQPTTPTPTTPTPTATVTEKPKIESLTIATGTVGGVYIYYGQGVASILNKYCGIPATAVQTKASVDNLLYISKAPKETIGLSLVGTLYKAYNGQLEAFNNQPQQWIRALWLTYGTPIHIVTYEGSGIKTIYDLKNRKVSTGPPASGTEVDALAILKAAGMDPSKDFAVWQKLGPKESADALLDGKLDAFFWSGTVPTGSISELAVSLSQKGKKLVFVEVPEEVMQNLQKDFPNVYYWDVIPKDAYGTDSDYKAVSVGNYMVTSAEMPDEVAYTIVKCVFEHLDDLYAVHAAAKQTTLDRAVIKGPVPFHPGAIKYFQEVKAWK